MYQQIKKLADDAIALQNKDRMDAVLREISAMCKLKTDPAGALDDTVVTLKALRREPTITIPADLSALANGFSLSRAECPDLPMHLEDIQQTELGIELMAQAAKTKDAIIAEAITKPAKKGRAK